MYWTTRREFGSFGEVWRCSPFKPWVHPVLIMAVLVMMVKEGLARIHPSLPQTYNPPINPNMFTEKDLALAGANVMGMLVKPEKLVEYNNDEFRYGRLTNPYKLEQHRRLVRKYRTLDVFGDLYQYPSGKVESRDFGHTIHNPREGAIRPYEKERAIKQMQNDALEMLFDRIIETIHTKTTQSKLSWPFFMPEPKF